MGLTQIRLRVFGKKASISYRNLVEAGRIENPDEGESDEKR
jgi:hypothetical protein